MGQAGYVGANNDGAYEQSTLVADASGNFYGSAQWGGTFGLGAVFEVAGGSSAMTGVASFNRTDGANPTGVSLDADGNLFGTTGRGGQYNDGTAFEIARGSNAITTLASFDGTNGQTPVGGVTIGGAGNLFGATQSGGSSSGGTVFEIAKGSATITTLASFSNPGPFSPGAGVTLNSLGNIYGTTQYGGTGNFDGGTSDFGAVYEIASGSNAITTLASFNATNGSDPYSTVSLDAAGNLYGTTWRGGTGGEGTVFELPAGSDAITTLISFMGKNGAYPYVGVALDSSGNLFGTTSEGGSNGDGVLYEIAYGSNTLTTLWSFATSNVPSPDGGVLLDGSGDVYGIGGVPGTVFEYQTGPLTLSTVASADPITAAAPGADD